MNCQVSWKEWLASHHWYTHKKNQQASGVGPAVFGGSIAEDCRHFQNRSGLNLLTFVLLQSDVEHLAHQQGEAALAKDLNTITCHFAGLGGIEV